MSKKSNPFEDVFNSQYVSSKENLPKAKPQPECNIGEMGSALVTKKDAAIGEIVDKAIASDGWRYCNGVLRHYSAKHGHFQTLNNKNDLLCEIRLLFPSNIRSQISDNCLNEIAKRLSISKKIRIAQTEMNAGNGRYINCQNGVLDLDTLELKSHNPKYLFTYVNHADFVEGGLPDLPEVLKRLLKTSLGGVKKKIILFFEMTGYLCSPCILAKKALFFIGPPDCGKSTVQRVFVPILGVNSISGIPINRLGDRFSNSELSSKRANLNFDLSKYPISDISAFKVIVGGDYDKGERKNGSLYAFQQNIKLMFGGNYLPELKTPEPSNAFINRICLLKFNEVPKDKHDSTLEDEMMKHKDIIFTHAMHALKRLRDNGYHFTEDPESQRELEVYKQEIDNVTAFFNSCCTKADEKRRIYTRDLYAAYQKWCKNNCVKSFTQSQFSSGFAAAFGYSPTTIRVNGGTPAKGYKGIAFSEDM